MLSVTRASTISKVVNEGKMLELPFEKFFLKNTLTVNEGNQIIVNQNCILDEYWDEILKISKVVTLSDSEYEDYRYKPKKFCFDFYGCTDLWFILLRLNNMVSVIDFDKKKIRIFTDEIFSTLNLILTLEEEKYQRNLHENK